MAVSPSPSSSSSSLSSNCTFVQPELPDECWESILKHINNPHDHESLSLVSKQFLSFINRIHTHLTISEGVLPLLPALLRRFTSLTSIKLNRKFTGDIDALLSQIASFDLPSLRSLDISKQSTFPSHGLRQFSQKFPSLKSFNCSHTRPDLFLIAKCFPNLEEIDVSFTSEFEDTDLHVKALALTSGFKKLRKVDLSRTYFFEDSSLFTFCQNCVYLEAIAVDECSASKIAIANAIRERPELRSLEFRLTGDDMTSELIDTLVSLKFLTFLDLSDALISDEALCAIAEGGPTLRELYLHNCKGYGFGGISCLLRKCNNLQCLDLQETVFLNDQCVIELSLLLGNLKVVKLSMNEKLTDLSLFAIMRNCSWITEIRMDNTGVGKLHVDCLVVNSHLKFLHLALNSGLDDEIVTMIASVSPNLEMIDLTNSCGRISKGAIEVLWRCCKIQCMDLHGIGLDLPQFQFRVNFEVPTLFVLNLSMCRISDEEISLLSKSCYNLKELNLDCCDITNNGVKQVVKNCKQLRRISLMCCPKVTCDVVAWMVFARPSLRKIVPPNVDSSDIDRQRDFFLRRGCFVLRSEDVDYECWGEDLDFLESHW
ncbi:hypothetical protein PIB30_010426 [Stylosanthes scabra]|uniref:F-box domain-containing protein n=1 Tax=Stylosanthes scabra TaxID=79078 RepID=A0ABU6X568_9FABA|nr:hypothetical protein [Stylosanthes scabra]